MSSAALPKIPTWLFFQGWQGLATRGSTFSHPHKPRDWISEVSPSLNSEFEWSEQLSPLPPNQPSSGSDPCWRGNPPLPVQAAPLVKWAFDLLNWGSVWGIFFQDRGKTPLRKAPLSLALHPEGKIKERTQSDFCNLLSYFILYLRSIGSTVFEKKKKKKNPVRKNKNVYDSVFSFRYYIPF